MKEVIISFLIALVVGAFINQAIGPEGLGLPPGTDQPPQKDTQGAPEGGSETAPTAGGGTTSSIAETSATAFNTDVLNSSEPVLVDFYASWCGPCKRMNPIVDQLAQKYDGKVKFFRVDVDKERDLATQYNVNAIPTFIVFKDGKRGASFQGEVPSRQLDKAIATAI